MRFQSMPGSWFIVELSSRCELKWDQSKSTFIQLLHIVDKSFLFNLTRKENVFPDWALLGSHIFLLT